MRIWWGFGAWGSSILLGVGGVGRLLDVFQNDCVGGLSIGMGSFGCGVDHCFLGESKTYTSTK